LPPGALLERLPPVAVKGKSEPVEAFVLRSL
jgi:class 3 adenylate cyclase